LEYNIGGTQFLLQENHSSTEKYSNPVKFQLEHNNQKKQNAEQCLIKTCKAAQLILTRSHLGVAPAELSEIAVDLEVFQVFLGLLSP